MRILVQVVGFTLLSCAILAQQNEPAWQDGTVGRVDVVLFEGSHVDKPGHVSIFRATGCTYVKKCGWVVTMEVQQADRKLILQKKIPVHNHMVSMHFEDVNLREGDHVRLREGSQKDTYVLLDRDGTPHDFSLQRMVQLTSQSPTPRQEAPVNAALSTAAVSSQAKTAPGGTLGIVTSDWEQSGFTGVEITDISADCSAALAGLHKGDVITEVNAQKLRSSQDLNDLIKQIEPGSKVSIAYLVKTNLGWVGEETVAILAKRE